MNGRPPSKILAVDANILLGAILGRSLPIVIDVARHRRLLTSEGVHREVLGTLLSLNAARERSMIAEILFKVAPPLASDDTSVAAAGTVLTRAVASRNGSAADAHLLAVAWLYDADVWSHDRDFAGTGWPSWSSANLVAALHAAQVG